MKHSLIQKAESMEIPEILSECKETINRLSSMVEKFKTKSEIVDLPFDQRGHLEMGMANIIVGLRHWQTIKSWIND